MEVTKQHHIVLPAQSWSLQEVRAFCKAVLEAHSVDEQVYRQLILAIDEAAANIVEHAYPNGKKKNLELLLDVQSDRVVIEIRDTGVPFDPLAVELADPLKPFSRRGYGISLIRRIMDEMQYRRSEIGENVLVMTKRLNNRRSF